MNTKRWNNYFMAIARETAKMSKDPITKVGAVITKDRRILSIGYNGAPHGFNDEIVPKDSESCELVNQKNTYMVHSELNAILNFRGSLSELKDSIVYVTVSPCHECAKALIQLGVKAVIYDTLYHRKETSEVTKKLFDCCGVQFISLEEANGGQGKYALS